MTIVTPESHRDLVDKAIVSILTTLMPNGDPQSSPVWRLWDDGQILIMTNTDTQKYRNLTRDPRVALVTMDLANPSRYVEYRGRVASITPDMTYAALNRMSQFYVGKDYYGGVVPESSRGTREHVVLSIAPERIYVR